MVFSSVRLFSEVLSSWLQTQPTIAAASECCDADELAACLSEFEPDIILFDISSHQALEHAHTVSSSYLNVRIIAVAMSEIADQVIACADAGFFGYFPREASLDELCPVIEKAMRNECTLHPRIAVSLMRELRRRTPACEPPVCDSLTCRESEVLGLLDKGLCNKNIARELDISVATVKNHLHSVFSKLHVSSRTEAVARLREAPLLARSA